MYHINGDDYEPNCCFKYFILELLLLHQLQKFDSWKDWVKMGAEGGSKRGKVLTWTQDIALIVHLNM